MSNGCGVSVHCTICLRAVLFRFWLLAALKYNTPLPRQYPSLQRPEGKFV